MAGTGADHIQKLRDSGATEEEIQQWKTSSKEKLVEAGFNKTQITEYFGGGPVKYDSIDEGVREGFKTSITGAELPEDENVNMVTAFQRGLSGGITGILKNKEAPLGIGQDEAIWDQIAFGLGEMLSDAPVSIPSFVVGTVPGVKGGGAIGAAGGGAIGSVVPGAGTAG